MDVRKLLKEKGSIVQTVRPDDSIADMVGLFERHNIGSAVVTEASGKVLGVITERVVVRGLAQLGADVLNKKVSDLMRPGAIGCRPENDLMTVMSIMKEHGVRYLPVLDHGRLAGIVSMLDVIHALVSIADVEEEVVLHRMAGIRLGASPVLKN